MWPTAYAERRDGHAGCQRHAGLANVNCLLGRAAGVPAAAEHLVKGQAVSFSGRFEPREYTTNNGDKRLALEIHDVAIEYGAKPRAAEPDTGAADTASSEASDDEDIPF